jgi:hypothetical protein
MTERTGTSRVATSLNPRNRSADSRASSDPRTAPRTNVDPLLDLIPDVRDGLTRTERIVLWTLYQCQQERPGRNIASATHYGRVVEHVNLSPQEFQAIVARLGAMQK